MKKILLAVVALAAVMFASCNKNPEENKPLTAVFFSEFSILKEDNKFLDKDYVFTNLDRTSTINITLPNNVSPDNLKTIYFRYSTTPEDAVVSVDEVVLEEAINKHSFENPVEFHLSAGEDLWAYTVNIKIAESAKWAVVATTPITDTLYTTPTVAYDQSADKFIIMDALRSKTGNNYPVYYEFSNNRFSDIKVISEVIGTDGHAIDVLNGVPYFAYADKSASISTRGTIVKVENGKTTLVGEQGAIAKVNKANNCALIAESENSIWYASTANEAYDGTTKRGLNLAKYDGSSWKNAKPIEGRPSAAYGYGQYSRKVGNATYLLVCNQNTFSTSVYKLENGVWSTVYESLVPEVPEGITASKSTVSWFNHFAITTDGTIYLCAQTQNAEQQFNLSIQKYNPGDNKLELVSWIPQSASSKGGIIPYMELDKNGNPIVVFQGSNDTRCFAATFNNDTKAFEVDPVHNHETDDLPKVIVDKHGTPYIFLLDNKEDRIVVCKPL